MSAMSERKLRVDRLRTQAAEASRLAGVGDVRSSAQSIATSLAALVGENVEDQLKDYNRDREWRESFAAELRRLATDPTTTTLTPAERTRRLLVLAQWLDEGYDGPPDADVYAEGFAPVGWPKAGR